MIRDDILDCLRAVSDEEQAILDGRTTIDSTLYTESGDLVFSKKRLIGDGKQIAVRAHTRFIHFPEHTHDYVEAVYMCQGSTTHIINGKRIVLREGELLFLGQNARQEILPAGIDDIAVNFIILPTFFDKTLEMLGAEETPIKSFLLSSLIGSENTGYLHFKVADVPPIENLVENLIWTLSNGTPNKRNINQTTMGLLFMQLLNYTDRLAYDTRLDAAIMDVFRYIEENYRDGSLTAVAEELHYDVFWLSREIHNRTGKTYTEHVQEKRLSQAAYLLSNTVMSVEEIASFVGYENKSYFHRIFSSKFGMTPRAYRISHSKI